MFNQDNPDIEVLTPAERLALLLQEVAQDMQAGNLYAACTALKEIQANRAQCNLLRSLPDLKYQYDYLSQMC